MKKRVLGIIPARGGSKGIPNKNIKQFLDKPLIAHTIINAKKCTTIDKLIVSTDSQAIADVAISFGANVPFLRPLDIATDTTRAIEVIKHTIIEMEKIDNTVYEYIVYLEPTSPNRSVDDINNAINLFIQNGDSDSLASVFEVSQYHPILMKKIVENRLVSFCIDEPEGMPRQLYSPKAFMRNGAVYIFKRSNILNNRMWGEKILPYIMPPERSSCIDDMNDWILAEYWMKQLNQL